jgi:peptidoglycan/LPS O-acetylase OafA/YrhL
MKRYPLFDVLRLLCALEVVRAHYTQSALFFPAVPMFLAISGFCILGSYERSKSWGAFAWKRVCRVYPAFLAMLALVFVLGGPLNCWLVVRTYLTLGLIPGTWNNAVWSLGWEELYYGLLAILFTFGLYKKGGVIASLAVAFALIGGAVPMLFPHCSPFLKVAAPLGVAFFIGNLCYMNQAKLPLWVGTWTVGIGAVAYQNHWVITGSALCAFGAVAVGLVPCNLPKFPDLSYSLYIYHLPMKWFIYFGLHKNLWEAFAVTAAVCIVSWYLVEQPALKLKDWRFRPQSQRLKKSPLLAIPVPTSNVP